MVNRWNQITKLATVLGMAGLDGSISIAALAGLFKPENALMLSILFIAGPGSVITALTLDGPTKQRILTALIAGIFATIIVILAAGAGTKILGFIDLNILRIFGGISILVIAFLIMGVKMNENIPLAIMFFGIILSAVVKFMG